MLNALASFFIGPLQVKLAEKITVMVVTSSADRPQICSERVRNLSGFNRDETQTRWWKFCTTYPSENDLLDLEHLEFNQLSTGKLARARVSSDTRGVLNAAEEGVEVTSTFCNEQESLGQAAVLLCVMGPVRKILWKALF